MELSQPRKLLISIRQIVCKSNSSQYQMSLDSRTAHVRDVNGAKKLRS